MSIFPRIGRHADEWNINHGNVLLTIARCALIAPYSLKPLLVDCVVPLALECCRVVCLVCVVFNCAPAVLTLVVGRIREQSVAHACVVVILPF